MIVKTAADFRAAIQENPYPIKFPPTMKAAFMVSPVGFYIDEQTAQDNEYMQLDAEVSPARAIVQQAELARQISLCGVPVMSFPGSPDTPDAVFPNNAFATTHGKRYIVGAMLHKNRMKETQRDDIKTFFEELLGYEKYGISDLQAVAELTGVLVPNRARNVGFVGMTERVDEPGVMALHEGFKLDLTFQFDLKPSEYHTNVVMACLAGKAVVINPDAFADPKVVDAIAEFYSGRTLLISNEEKHAFVGNCIAITDKDIFFSKTALQTITDKNRMTLEDWGFDLHGVDVSELEKAGGSLRCMVGEIF